MSGRPNVVFLTGATRSGTTWLQNLLGSHPEIATPQESDLMSYYVAPWWEQWHTSLPESEKEWSARRHNGLPSIITEDEFDEILGGVIDRIYTAAGELKPSASMVLDKVPGYGFYSALLLRHLPETRVLHVIRDGRDVTSSMRRASKGFGRLWAASTVDYAAWAWESTVIATQQMRGLSSYAEVRYEDLRGQDGATALAGAFEFLGVETTVEECENTLRRFSLEGNAGRPPSSIVWGGEVIKRLGEDPEEPSDFFGEGRTGGGRDTFSWYDRWLFDRYAGDTLVELGYEKDREWVGVGAILGALAHVRFFFDRWKVLARTGLGKVRRNLKPRERQIPSAAVTISEKATKLSGSKGA